METEVLVLGDGPAAAAAALTLARRGRQVLLAARPGSHRVVGEVLPPGAQAGLAALGYGGLFDNRRHRAAWTQGSAWGSDRLAVRDFALHPGGCAWHLDREIFDADLLSGARRAGATELRDATLRHADRQLDGRWLVALTDHGTVRATHVIDATGRASAFARQLGLKRCRLDRLVALVGLVPMEAAAKPDLVIEARPCGWWYTVMLPDGRAVAALLTDLRTIPAGREAQSAFWHREVLQTTYVLPRLRISGRVEVQAVPAATEYLQSAYGEGWIAAGDAVASFDPLSSMGLTHALDTGRMAALAVDAALAGERQLLASYAQSVRRRVDECDLLRRSYYAMERRWPAAPFWARSANPTAPPHSLSLNA